MSHVLSDSPTRPAGIRALLAPLADVVFTTDPRRRDRLRMSMLVSLLYLMWIGAELYSGYIGLLDPQSVRVMVAVNAVGAVSFWMAIRLGLTQRLDDPSLMLPQCFYAAFATILGYALMPVLRAPLLQLLCLGQLYGMLTLKPGQVARLGAGVVAMMGVMLGVMSVLQPAHFNVHEEALRLALAAFVLALLTLNSMRFGRVRLALKAQRAELAQAVAQVQELVTHDTLTGLFNRQHLQELLVQEAQRQDRAGQPFCVALLDLDHFKRVNDTHGHQAGDEVLCGFAQVAQQVLRETDVIGRWGGEEFLVLLRETDIIEPALAGLERLRQQLAMRTLAPSVPGLTTAFSAGVARRQAGEPIERLLERADAALYQAKEAGRNRSVVAD